MEAELELAAHNFTVFMLGGAAIVCAVIGFIIVFIFYYRNKQIQHQKEKAKLKFEYEKALLTTQMEIAEETLKKVSCEIHDNILQRLTLTKLNLNSGIQNQPDKIQHAHDLLNEALTDLRNMSHMLNGSFVMKMGLENAIRQELDLIAKTAQIEGNFILNSSKDESSFNEQQEIILFRCVQEGLNNAVKYSKCTHIEVKLTEKEDCTVIEIHDNGAGFDVLTVKKGLGLINISERSKILGGKMEIQSESGKGTTLKIFIPHDGLKFTSVKLKQH